MKQRTISRQRKWQLENLAAGKCKLCPKLRAIADPTFCEGHREVKREQNREYMRRKRRTPEAARHLAAV